MEMWQQLAHSLKVNKPSKATADQAIVLLRKMEKP